MLIHFSLVFMQKGSSWPVAICCIWQLAVKSEGQWQFTLNRNLLKTLLEGEWTDFGDKKGRGPQAPLGNLVSMTLWSQHVISTEASVWRWSHTLPSAVEEHQRSGISFILSDSSHWGVMALSHRLILHSNVLCIPQVRYNDKYCYESQSFKATSYLET